MILEKKAPQVSSTPAAERQASQVRATAGKVMFPVVGTVQAGISLARAQ